MSPDTRSCGPYIPVREPVNYLTDSASQDDPRGGRTPDPPRSAAPLETRNRKLETRNGRVPDPSMLLAQRGDFFASFLTRTWDSLLLCDLAVKVFIPGALTPAVLEYPSE